MVASQTQKKKITKRNFRGGFTIIEMLAVTMIIVVITTVVLYNYRNFRNSSEFRNIAYELQLTLRDSQVRAMTVLETQESPENFYSGYGVQASQIDTWAYTMYADEDHASNDLRWYDELPICNLPAVMNECFFEKELPSGYVVQDICVTDMASSRTCGHNVVDISFKRPEPSAHIVTSQGGARQAKAEIILESPASDTITVVVTAAGQIYLD